MERGMRGVVWCAEASAIFAVFAAVARDDSRQSNNDVARVDDFVCAGFARVERREVTAEVGGESARSGSSFDFVGWI